MYWINYIIKTIIRRIVYILIKPKYLIVFLVIVLVFLLLANSSFAVYQGDDTYTDKNNTIFNAYNIITNDFINRMQNSTYSDDVSNLKELLTNGQYSAYFYYGNINGTSMLGSSVFNTKTLYIAVYEKDADYSSSMQTNYQGIDTNIGTVNNVYKIYSFINNNLYYENGQSIQLPTILINYISSDLLLYLNDSSSSETSEIVGALENQTQATQDVQNSVDNLQNTIVSQDTNTASTDMNNTFTDISDSTSDYDNEVDNIVDFYKQLNQAFKDVFDSIVEGQAIELDLGLPFIDKSITLKSDIVRNAINGTVFYVFLQLCYTTLFAFYLINSFFNIINWLQSGEFLNGKFVSHKNLILKPLN